MMQTATTTSKVDKTVPSPRPISSAPSEGIRTRRLSLNIPNPPIRTPTVPVPARQGSIHRHRTSFSTSVNSPQDRRLGSSLSLSLSSARGVWSGKEGQERFKDDEWLKIKLDDVGTDEVGSVVRGEEGMEKAVEVIPIPQLMIEY